MPGLGGNWKSTYIIKIFRLSTTFGNIYKLRASPQLEWWNAGKLE
jgi:hypothetical protein